MTRANEMNWLDFESTLTMVKTPKFSISGYCRGFPTELLYEKKEFQEMVATNSILTRVSICSNLDVTEGSHVE